MVTQLHVGTKLALTWRDKETATQHIGTVLHVKIVKVCSINRIVRIVTYRVEGSLTERTMYLLHGDVCDQHPKYGMNIDRILS